MPYDWYPDKSKMPCDKRGRGWVMQRQVNKFQESATTTRNQEEAKGRFPPEPQRDQGPTDTLMSEFQPPDLPENELELL